MFTGSTAPFHITQPSTDNDVQIVSSTATMATLTCSLNVTIPSRAVVTWTHNVTINVPLSQVSTTGSTTTLTIENPQSSDAGVYECAVNDVGGSEWTVRRNIILLVTGMYGTKQLAIYMHVVISSSCIVNDVLLITSYPERIICHYVSVSFKQCYSQHLQLGQINL